MKHSYLSDFEKNEWIEYCADEVRIVNDFRKVSFNYDYPLTRDFVVIMFCISGKLSITIDENDYTVRKGQVLFLLPSNSVTKHSYSADLDTRSLLFSVSILENNILLRRKLWDSMYYLLRNPVQTLSQDSIRILWHYHSIATAKIGSRDTSYRHEVVNHLVRSLIYEFLLLVEEISPDELPDSRQIHQQQSDDLHRRFLLLLVSSRGRVRRVSQFADKLCVTPDQLTVAVRTVSGRTPMDWINENTIKLIKDDLLYSAKPIKEIADDLDFPSLSFFGKYVKQHTGYSPRQLRERHGEQA
jgi:AraC-like DNA-binding protein